MKPHQPGILNRAGKALAGPLSRLVTSLLGADLARLAEAYWGVLLGKGAGSGWALDAEINAARAVIHTTAPVVLDVGANTGEWALRLHQAFPQARLFLFEPQPLCQQEIRSRSLPNAVLIPQAVSSAGGVVTLHTSASASGIASLHPRGDSPFQDRDYTPIEVAAVTIDDAVQRFDLARVDFLKMDIEGHELEALRGAARSLESGVIRALSFEFGSANVNSRTFFRDFWDLLHPLGYRIYRVLPSSRLLPIEEYYEDCEYFRGVTNYVAASAASGPAPAPPARRASARS